MTNAGSRLRDRDRPGEIGDAGILLGMLSAIERDSRVTQRGLAQELRVALGLTNAYLKRCAKKGYIKIRQVPLNRYAYYLTPRGFAEKSRLTAEYLSSSLDFFRQARRDAVSVFEKCRARGWTRVALYGAGDLAEIAVISAADAGIEVVCVVVQRPGPASCAGRPAAVGLAKAIALAGTEQVDAIVVTDTLAAQASFDAARADAARHGIDPDRVLALDLLRVVVPAGKAAR